MSKVIKSKRVIIVRVIIKRLDELSKFVVISFVSWLIPEPCIFSPMQYPHLNGTSII